VSVEPTVGRRISKPVASCPKYSVDKNLVLGLTYLSVCNPPSAVFAGLGVPAGDEPRISTVSSFSV
jgi:hypothetical protein